MDHQVHEKGTWEIQDGFHTEFDSKSDLREVKHKESHASRQHFADHATRHICQPEVSPQVLIRQLLVVQSQQMQDRRVQIVDVNATLDRPAAELVRRTMAHSGPDSGPGQQGCESIPIVFPPGSPDSARVVLKVRSPAKFARADDERILQEPSLFQIFQQSGDRSIDSLAALRMRIGNVPVMVP